MDEFVQVIYYPFGNAPVKQYVIRLIHEPVMENLMRVYRSSPLMNKLARRTADATAASFDGILKGLKGELFTDPNSVPTEYRLTHRFSASIDDKLNAITFMEQEIISDLKAVSDDVTSKGYEKIDLGRLHWKLLIDIECLLYFCRSILDLFARLTRVLYKQISGVNLPDSFADQVAHSNTHAKTDGLYFTHLSELSWFSRLRDYRDDLTHKVSLTIVVAPGSEPHLQTTEGTKIDFEEVLSISSEVKSLARWYVEHFSSVLQTCQLA